MKVKIQHNKTYVEAWKSDDEKEKVLKHLKLIYSRREGKRIIYDHTENLYNRNEQSFPTGYLEQLAHEIEKYGIDIDGEDERAYPRSTIHLPIKINHSESPDRVMQLSVSEKIRDNPVGMIIAPPGAGKSRAIKIIVSHFRVRTLVVVPTTKIQQQVYDMFASEFGTNNVSRSFSGGGFLDDQTLKKKMKVTNRYRPKNIDINADILDEGLTPEEKYLQEKGYEKINGKMIKVRRAIDGKAAKDKKSKYPPILVICFNSLPNLPLEYLSSVECLIVDEGHTARNNTIQAAALEMNNAAYRYFLSATNWADIKEDMKKLIATTGSTIIHEELPSEAIEAGIIKKPHMRIVNTNNSDRLRKYLKGDDLIKLGIVGNAERNLQVCSLARELFATEGRRIMICVWEDSHAMILQESLRNMGINAHMYFSKLDTKEKERVDSIVSNSTEPFIAICTIALGIGADTRGVDTIILADVRKATIQLLQRIGRGHRIMDGVTDLWVYDFKDGFNDTTYKWHAERQKTFNDYYFKNESFTKRRASKFGITLKNVSD